MKNFKVSVLVPCHNGEKFVKKCIDSILKQTYGNFELVLIDDGSTDNTFKIFTSYAKKDKRIRAYRNEQNQKIAETRNLLIEKVTGDYFLFVDSDDWLHRKAIERLTNKVWEKEKTDVVVGKSSVVQYFSNKQSKYWRFTFFPSSLLSKKMSGPAYVKSNICVAWGSLIRTSFYRNLKISFYKGKDFEDLGVMSYVYMNAKTFATTRKNCYYYFRHPYSISSFQTMQLQRVHEIVFQTRQNLERFREKGFLKDKKMRNAINGWIFMSFSLLYWIDVKSKFNPELNSKEAKEIFEKIKFDLIYVVRIEFQMRLRFSKTWWKSIMYFLLKSYFSKQIKLVDQIAKDKGIKII